jgi:hypothetical protein
VSYDPFSNFTAGASNVLIIHRTGMNGQVVPLGKSLNSQVPGLTLRSGGPGVLAGMYPEYRESQCVQKTDVL